MPNTSFNLVQTIAVLQRRWKIILFFVIATVIAATVTVFLVPQYFKSTAVVVSANPVLADKARLFNNQVQNLYSYFGSGDDLDRIYGIADLDTTYKQLVDEFSLISYYKPDEDSLPIQRRKAVKHLRKNLTIQKTEQGELAISCWTNNKQLSANIVNRMVAIIQEMGTAVWQKNYTKSLSQLNQSVNALEQEYQALSDSVAVTHGGKHELGMAKLQTLLEQIRQYRKTANEFKLTAETNPAALYVLETAVPAAKAERPDKPGIIFAALIAGFIFSCLLVLVTDRNQQA